MPDPKQVAASIERAYAPLPAGRRARPFAITDGLKDDDVGDCGLVRTGTGYSGARAPRGAAKRRVVAVTVTGPREANSGWQEALDVRNQLTVARRWWRRRSPARSRVGPTSAQTSPSATTTGGCGSSVSPVGA